MGCYLGGEINGRIIKINVHGDRIGLWWWGLNGYRLSISVGFGKQKVEIFFKRS